MSRVTDADCLLQMTVEFFYLLLQAIVFTCVVYFSAGFQKVRLVTAISAAAHPSVHFDNLSKLP